MLPMNIREVNGIWTEKFAWIPVRTVEDDIVWLEKVWVRTVGKWWIKRVQCGNGCEFVEEKTLLEIVTQYATEDERQRLWARQSSM